MTYADLLGLFDTELSLLSDAEHAPSYAMRWLWDSSFFSGEDCPGCGFLAVIGSNPRESTALHEVLANLLAVHLIRHVVAPSRPLRGRDGVLPRGRLRAVVEYVEEHLDAGPSLEQMAAVARLSAYHFARQFKTATGLPPHQYATCAASSGPINSCKQERGPFPDRDRACAGFSDQSQFSHHFKRVVGVTPRQFRKFARFAQHAARASKKLAGEPLTIPHEQRGSAWSRR